MKRTEETYFIYEKENEGRVECYVLAPGIFLMFDQIFTSSWTKGDSSIFSDEMLILNFCRNGRCDVSLTGSRYAIVKEKQVCASTILPTKDFYYPGRYYEGVQIYIDRSCLRRAEGNDLLSQMGLDIEQLIRVFCTNNGLYLHRMNDGMEKIVENVWEMKADPELGMLRYAAIRLLHEWMQLPYKSETAACFTRSQIAIVKEAENMILQDLSKRITAKEMADHFGISESSFKLYVKGILGESYLVYFRKKRMERAAELLSSTTLKVIEIADAVGYENQGKFAKVFSEVYGMTPLEYRRWVRKGGGKKR